MAIWGKYYDTKIINTSFIEVYEYGSPICYGYEDETREKKKRTSFNEASIKEKSERIERMKKYHLNQRWELCRLIDVNYDNKSSFITITFKENISDINYANNEFKKFIKRLNYEIYKTKEAKLKYIAAWELQKRGSIHYHIIFFSLPYISHSKLKKIWTLGSINIKKINVDKAENVGRYISKYFEKSLDDPSYLENYINKKRVFKSKNLKIPRIKYELNNKPYKYKPSDVIYQKTYIAYRKNEDGSFHEYPVKYTKLKKGGHSNE